MDALAACMTNRSDTFMHCLRMPRTAFMNVSLPVYETPQVYIEILKAAFSTALLEVLLKATSRSCFLYAQSQR